MKHVTTSGRAIAAAAFALAVSGTTMGTLTGTASAEEAKVHCVGVNACKGQAECKTASNDCKGMNACKGQGFVSLTKAECDAQGGKVEES